MVLLGQATHNLELTSKYGVVDGQVEQFVVFFKTNGEFSGQKVTLFFVIYLKY